MKVTIKKKTFAELSNGVDFTWQGHACHKRDSNTALMYMDSGDQVEVRAPDTMPFASVQFGYLFLFENVLYSKLSHTDARRLDTGYIQEFGSVTVTIPSEVKVVL